MVSAMAIAPLLANTTSIFSYLQKMNGMYFIPIFSVVLVGMLTKRVPSLAAKIALVIGFLAIAIGYFVPPFDRMVTAMHEYHFLGLVFACLVVLMLLIAAHLAGWLYHALVVKDRLLARMWFGKRG